MPRKLSIEEINSRLSQRNIKMIGDDVAVVHETYFQCCVCDHVFKSTLQNLIYNAKTKKGEFCQQCEYNKYTHKLDEIGYQILTTIDQYKGSVHSIEVKCKQCNVIFNARAQVLIKGNQSSGCGCVIRTRAINHNLKGTKVGHILIISNLIFRNIKGYNCVRGLCDCGSMTDLRVDQIRVKKRSETIGCNKCSKQRHAQAVQTWQVGQKFGTLTIISDAFLVKRNRYVETQCDCGNIERSATIDLTLGRKKTCTQCRLNKHLEYNRDRADKYLAIFEAKRLTEDIPNGQVRIWYQCKCGRKNRILLSYLQQLVERKNKPLICRCEKIKNGVSTSNAAIKLHENLDRGVHNFQAKSGNIDIALVYQGKKIAIEYDEWWWHKDKQNLDKKKTAALLEDGWYVLRLRVSTFVPNKKFLQKALKRLVKTPSRLLLLTHKSWRGYKKDLKDSTSALL